MVLLGYHFAVAGDRAASKFGSCATREPTPDLARAGDLDLADWPDDDGDCGSILFDRSNLAYMVFIGYCNKGHCMFRI